MKGLNVILFLLLLISCSNRNKNEVAAHKAAAEKSHEDPIDKIASLYKVTVTPLNGKGSAQDTYSIKVDNLNLETKTGYPPAFIASKSATIIYESLTAPEKSTIKSIIVNVNSIVQTEAFTYTLTGLKKIAPYLQIARSGVQKYIDGSYDDLYGLLDPAYFSKADYEKFINNHRKPYPETFEGIKEIKDDGFEFREEQGLKVISVYFTTVSSNKTELEWEVVFADNDESPKIGGFHVIP